MTRTLAHVLDEHLGSQAIDLLEVDCEGPDLDVLRPNDWGRSGISLPDARRPLPEADGRKRSGVERV